MIVFLGDSITEWWDAEYFNKYFELYNPINLGMAGHTTKDTIEFLELSHFNEFKPSNVVLQIGTNDGNGEMSTGETASNIDKICMLILEYSPNTRILLVGPLPRGETLQDRHCIYNREVNKLLRVAKRDERITYIDIGNMFTNDEGKISREIMYDYLHLTKRGYILLSELVSEFLFSSAQSASLRLSAPRPS